MSPTSVYACPDDTGPAVTPQCDIVTMKCRQESLSRSIRTLNGGLFMYSSSGRVSVNSAAVLVTPPLIKAIQVSFHIWDLYAPSNRSSFALVHMNWDDHLLSRQSSHSGIGVSC